MTPRKATIAGALILLAATVLALKQGTATKGTSHAGRRFWASPPGWVQSARTRCVYTTVRAEAACASKLGLSLDGGYTYATMRVCAEPEWDASAPSEEEALPDCLDRVDDVDVDDAPPDGSVKAVEVAIGALRRFRCACAPGASDGGLCEARSPDGGWMAAPRMQRLEPGQWRGAGCTGAPCTELAGWPSYPEACQ